jgi:hypothetical protein
LARFEEVEDHRKASMYIHYSEIDDLWGNGYTWIVRHKAGRKKLYGYLCKYLTKHVDDKRLQLPVPSRLSITGVMLTS